MGTVIGEGRGREDDLCISLFSPPAWMGIASGGDHYCCGFLAPVVFFRRALLFMSSSLLLLSGSKQEKFQHR